MSKAITSLLAGVVIGILGAPRKGSETRRRRMDGVLDIQDDFKDFIQDSAENLNSGMETAETQASGLLHKSKKEFSGFGK